MKHFLPIHHYLPHRPPMLLLDKLMAVSPDTCHCQVKISQHGVLAPFLTPEHDLPAWFGLEIMAQTIAVWSGWHQRQAGAAEIALGMLLGTRKYQVTQACFRAESTLDIHIQLLARDERIGSFDASVTAQDTHLAHARLTTCQLAPQELRTLIERKST